MYLFIGSVASASSSESDSPLKNCFNKFQCSLLKTKTFQRKKICASFEVEAKGDCVHIFCKLCSTTFKIDANHLRTQYKSWAPQNTKKLKEKTYFNHQYHAGNASKHNAKID